MAFSLQSRSALSNTTPIRDIIVEGNFRVEPEAILNAMSTKKNQKIDKRKIQKDIETLYDLGYFSKLYIFSEQQEQGVVLFVQVEEKPAIVAIEFTGLTKLKESELQDSLQTKDYSIVQEGKIAQDLEMIEKKYSEKGFFLVQTSYKLEQLGEKEVKLIFQVHENNKILVGDVYISGNHYFSDIELIAGLHSKPYTRGSAISSSSIFNENYVKRDAEFIAFYYRNHGFADVKVAQPIVQLDTDKSFARVTFQIEEGVQYYVKSIRARGDIGQNYYEEETLLQQMQLKEKDLFKHLYLIQDIEMLVNKYGDLGYAYVDVNPIMNPHPKTGEIDLIYEITKGKKVYFGDINIIGNDKTRDNVIRRELKIADGELYSGSSLSKSKENITRLGFFEEVQVQKNRSKEADLLDIKFKVKEKSTGHFQAALGFSPSGETKASWFGQTGYDEKNQSGKGWATTFNARWSASSDYMIGLSFLDPKVNDSPWSIGVGGSYGAQVSKYASDIEISEKRTNLHLTVGRSLFELVRTHLTLRHRNIKHQKDITLIDELKSKGIQNSLTLGLTRNNLNNAIDPSEGITTSFNQKFAGGFLRGDEKFMETTVDLSYYYPVDFSDKFRTYFKILGSLGFLSKWGNNAIPIHTRYRLGGASNLRGFKHLDIGPKKPRTTTTQGQSVNYNYGGNKQFYGQFEYYVPIIQQAGIKALVFADIGQVFEEKDKISLSNLKADVGFGFRLLTPMGPFRFEFAYPYDTRKRSLGEMQFVFNVGY